MAQRTFFGTIRLLILLAVLLFVGLGAWLDARRSTDWNGALRITVYPVSSAEEPVQRYVASLDNSSYQEIEQFFAAEAARFGVAINEPVRIRLSLAATEPPPEPPRDAGMPRVIAWSLRMRFWAWRVQANDPLPPPDIQVFALYHSATGEAPLPDSFGLRKGLMAVAHVYAERSAAGSNQVVLTHELFHTLGATDKYDPDTGEPRVPEGLGDPRSEPRYPQRTGEIMAGRIAIGPNETAMPDNLRQMRVGPLTAEEIGWK